MRKVPQHSPLQQRSAGILLHPTSLPGPWGSGDLGPQAYHFVDFLAAAGQRIWQILPIGPTHSDGSPYQSLSVYAGSPSLVSIDLLVEWGWLEAAAIERREVAAKGPLIALAHEHFRVGAEAAHRAEYADFVERNRHWLDDYALFRCLRSEQQEWGWSAWPAPLRDREPAALEQARARLAEPLERIRFEQFLFFRQWGLLKAHANRKGVHIFGDMPIFVAHDSADVWARREYFLLDATGRPSVVAGVPPDYFSTTGQRWGNPHYDWAYMERHGFDWWLQRMETQLTLFDLVRIDHFRGFQAYWEIAVEEPTAINGRWIEAPGDALFARLREHFDPLPVVAEDLGIITAEVVALRTKYALPGMKILHFAFDGGPDNPYLPHNQEANSVVYTGTHDNNTTVGWFSEQPPHARAHVLEYLGSPSEPIPWPLIRSAYASVANLAIVPLQDVLALGSEHRMNVPGTCAGNWRWRFEWEMVPQGLVERLRHMVHMYGRLD